VAFSHRHGSRPAHAAIHFRTDADIRPQKALSGRRAKHQRASEFSGERGPALTLVSRIEAAGGSRFGFLRMHIFIEKQPESKEA